MVSIFFIQLQAEDYPPFELWNKTSKPIWFAVLNTDNQSDDKIMSEPLIELPGGKYAIARSSLIDIRNFTRLLIVENPDKKSVTVCTFNPNKYIWVRIKENKDNRFFGPQTGPLLGLLGSTENGYPLDQNVTNSDYRIERYTRSPEQEGMMILKRAFRRVFGYPISQ